MEYKAVPLIVLSIVLLVGCTNKDEVPNKNETPMQDVQEDAKRSTVIFEQDKIDRNIHNDDTHKTEDKMNDGRDGFETEKNDGTFDENG